MVRGQRANRDARATAALSDALQRRDFESIAQIVREYASERSPDINDDLLNSLIARLRDDGWTLGPVEYEPPDRNQWDKAVYLRLELSVIGGGAVPLAEETTALQELLRDHTLVTAEGHYAQAVDAIAKGNWASANAQLRSAFESLLVEISAQLAGGSAKGGGGAINEIERAGHFLKGERNYIDGLWTLSHSNGSHPGLSNEEEATTRMSAVTAAMSYLVRRLL